ncbi:MAG: hypothetical protein L0Y58_25220 [Verrucomicrobia subdivision 3 bacterium]|nr:hypothetical protein [Limisphaerales bacterium]
MLTCFVSVFWAVACCAQGTVTFVNSGTFPTIADRLVYDIDGSPLVGTNYVAQLYYGADASSLQAHTAAPSRFRLPTTASPGTWSGGTRTLTGFGAGSTVAMQVRVWDSNYGATFEEASQKVTPANQYGVSCPFFYILPPPSCTCDFLMDNLRSFTLVTNPPAGIIAIREENGGCLQQVFLGVHNIDATPTLTGPWQSLGQQTSPFIDLQFTNLNARFYRMHDPVRSFLRTRSATIAVPSAATFP